jgi:hypothetical protein
MAPAIRFTTRRGVLYALAMGLVATAGGMGSRWKPSIFRIHPINPRFPRLGSTRVKPIAS